MCWWADDLCQTVVHGLGKVSLRYEFWRNLKAVNRSVNYPYSAGESVSERMIDRRALLLQAQFIQSRNLEIHTD